MPNSSPGKWIDQSKRFLERMSHSIDNSRTRAHIKSMDLGEDERITTGHTVVEGHDAATADTHIEEESVRLQES